MANTTRNFLLGRMNKTFDERVIPNGEYIDAMNVRMGSTENSEIGVIENTKGNIALTLLTYIDGTPLSVEAKCIGSFADSARETIYWMVHDPSFPQSDTGKLDMIVSFNVFTNILTYHIVSTDDGNSVNTTLNFNPKYLITGINMIGDLLFFTDDYNAPRFINIKENYPNPIFDIDQFNPESILVIKRPPLQSPSVELITTSSQDTYMDTRFLCFAYRYRYANGEYSATSQWSAPAFIPNPFEFSINSFLNEGMTNFSNMARITYNTGSSLVVGIDLLFKEANNNVIKVIEKLDKKELGLPDDSDQTYDFINSKIFTVLPDSELLRLYDNVPRFAKAQTIMGNRLMYANYVDGYDLLDADGRAVQLEYNAYLVSEVIGETSIPDSTGNGNYTINGPVTITDAVVQIDLANANLVEGAALSLEVTITHSQFTGNTPFPAETTANIELNFAFYLNQSYSSVYEMATSTEFQDAVGTALNIQPMSNAANGTTFTDSFNAALPNNLDALIKYRSGISVGNQAIGIISSPGSSIIGLQFLATRYVDSTTLPTFNVYEYYTVVFSEATFQEIASPRSLHSNRGYQIGIVYMDEFLRSTTALVSTMSDTVHIPCGASSNKNSIFVEIPSTQLPPTWATSYKFVIKPDSENYEVIYTSLFFRNPDTNEVYFLLEGENSRKVETGDRLIVKSDSSGATTTCVYATVLEKEAKTSGFIVPVSGATPPSGVYMKINPSGFAAVEDPNAVIAPGSQQVDETDGGSYVLQEYPMNIEDPNTPGSYIDYTVPAGSRIKMSIKFQRIGTGSGDRKCEKRIYTLEKTLVSSASYDNMKDWWDGDNVESILNSGIQDIGAGACEADNQYISSLALNNTDIPEDLCINYYRFYRYPSNKLVLLLRGTRSCPGLTGGNRRKSTIITDFQVFRATNLFIFETEPTDASPDIFYENDMSFKIENGLHMGNVQNQTSSLPAIIDTKFFNCFAFGNGAESFKIRDSIVGRSFGLGNRVTTVSAQDYKEANRFADITYSGVYNQENNVNKLNEFNLGLANFKNLETSFGEVYTIDGRETDVLVLQEDKISYVLAGKNLLSDATGGGAITSVPEVLGTQIARTEKYGISFNPESYVQWGEDRFFTDAKRGVVIQMKGNSYSSEQLGIISDKNMRTWFRDLFNNSFATQKLGAYDPYMNEYVLVSNDNKLPFNPSCLNCGISQTLTLVGPIDEQNTFSFCVNVGDIVGNTVFSWSVPFIDDESYFNVIAEFNGDTYESGDTSEDGFLEIPKDVNYINVINVTIEYHGNVNIDFMPNCPTPEVMRVVEVVITNNSEAGESMHAESRYTAGPFVSPLQSNLVIFASGTETPLVSRYNISSGYAGQGSFPVSGSTMRLQSAKAMFDSRTFNPSTDKFRYLRTNVLYNNTTADINTMLSLSTLATPILGGPTTYYADFIVPPNSTGEYLYIIWDLRSSVPVNLCYSSDNIDDVCCGCSPCGPEECTSILVTAQGSNCVINFPNGLCGQPLPYELNANSGQTVSLCVGYPFVYNIVSGNPIIQIIECDCVGCTEPCNEWIFNNTGEVEAAVQYTTCGGSVEIVKIDAGAINSYCIQAGTTPVVLEGAVEISFICGCLA